MVENLQELVTVEAKPAAIHMNFEEAKAALVDHVAQYNIVVTADTLKDSKAMATELNKTAKAIDRRRKEEIAKVMATVDPFNEQMKELVGICTDGRQGILSQAKIFEDETRQQCENALSALRAELFSDLKVDPDYWSAEYDDLIKLTSMTAAGNLTKSAQDTLRERVQADLGRQRMVENRILRIENESHRAGLSSPLTANHFSYLCLQGSDEAFDAKLAELIDIELVRDAEAEQRRQRKAEADRQAREANERAAAERQARIEAAREAEQAEAEHRASEQADDTLRQRWAQSAGEAVAAEAMEGHRRLVRDQINTQSESAAESPDQASAPPGRVMRKAVATFEVTVPEGTTDEAIEARLRSMLEAAGLKSLSSVEIHHV